MALNKLLPYQIPHTLQLQEALKVSQCVLDASDTGTGKTYCALAVCKLENLTPLIICPKSVINSWLTVAKTIGVDVLGISNYEMIKGCKYYTSDMKAVECPYIDKYTMPEEKDVKKKSLRKKVDKIIDESVTDPTVDTGKSEITIKVIKKVKKPKTNESFIFQFPKDIVMIFDEAHRCKNHKTITSRLLISAAEAGNKVILLSATISDKIQCFKPFGVVFGFYNDIKQFKMWMRRKIKLREIQNKIDKLQDDELQLSIIHNEIFPKKGSRIKIKDLGDLFPKNQVTANCYHSDDQDKINELYDIINSALEELKNKETRAEGLGKLIRARQKIEMFKVPIIMDLAEEAMDNGYSVVIFVNFHDTMNYICHHMECDCTIHGQQSLDERQSCIDDFQSNKCKMIVVIIQAGGVGVSLHDIHGGHPRMSIISPTWSGQDMVQALGRIHRAGSKTPAMQRIVYCAETYEEKICSTIQEKIRNINAINDGDLVLKSMVAEDLKIIEENINKLEKDGTAEEKPIKINKIDKNDEDKPIKLTKHNRPKGKYEKIKK
jgi:hypothetical protein